MTVSFPRCIWLGRFEEAVLANANCGGENVHRGCLLGALLGAHVSYGRRMVLRKRVFRQMKPGSKLRKSDRKSGILRPCLNHGFLKGRICVNFESMDSFYEIL